MVKIFVGVTDNDWFDFLSGAQPDEVNFWAPSGKINFRALQPGELFLFKLHSPLNFIVGGGVFSHASILPLSLAWEAFGAKNGAATVDEMRRRVVRYRTDNLPRGVDPPIERAALPSPAATTQEGERYGKPILVKPRLGQGAFRVVVTDAYERRCAVSGEKTLPILDAAHIRSYADGGVHEGSNGLLLRTDIHKLFDLGYVSVDEDRRFVVSRRLKEDFDNGKHYYDLHGTGIRSPRLDDAAPSTEGLTWHRENRFFG